MVSGLAAVAREGSGSCGICGGGGGGGSGGGGGGGGGCGGAGSVCCGGASSSGMAGRGCGRRGCGVSNGCDGSAPIFPSGVHASCPPADATGSRTRRSWPAPQPGGTVTRSERPPVGPLKEAVIRNCCPAPTPGGTVTVSADVRAAADPLPPPPLPVPANPCCCTAQTRPPRRFGVLRLKWRATSRRERNFLRFSSKK